MKSVSSKLMRLMSIGALSVISTLALLVSQASAADQFRRINTMDQIINRSTEPQLIQLNNAGATSLTVNCPTAPCKISIIYNAICLIQSRADTVPDFLAIRILVDNQAVPPTEEFKTFCSSQIALTPTPAPVTETEASFSTQAGATLTTAGPHTIQLQALTAFSNANEFARLLTTSIIVIRTP